MRMPSWIYLLPTVLALTAFTASASATTITYQMDMTGAQSVPGGDLDGSATGLLSLDDVSGLVSWDFTFLNIATPAQMHIHGPGGSAGLAAGIAIGLNVSTSGGPGTLISSVVTNPLLVAQIFGDPTDFYVNIHNVDFPAGAVRGQLGTVPEPALALLIAISGLALAASRRR